MSTPAPTIVWNGETGAEYRYWIYPLGTTFSAAPGNYVIARKSDDTGRYRPLYAGETSDLSTRFHDHDGLACAEQKGATHICVHKSSTSRQSRLDEEADIRRKWKPSCNMQ